MPDTVIQPPIPTTPVISAVLEKLATDPARGLTTEEAVARLRREGPNKLTEATPPRWWRNPRRRHPSR